MIRNIFIPQKIGSYTLFGKRTVGIDGEFSKICAVICYEKGRSKTIEKIVTQELETSTEVTTEQRIINALAAIRTQIGAFDELRCVLPSNLVIFKELTLPFSSLKKIKSIVPFEVEALLPFTLDQAVIDCIVTHTNSTTGESQVLVAAVKHELVAQYLHYFQAAGLNLNTLSVDMFDLYGLYQMKTQAATDAQPLCLLYASENAIRIALIVDNSIAGIRAVPKGLGAIQASSTPLMQVYPPEGSSVGGSDMRGLNAEHMVLRDSGQAAVKGDKDTDQKLLLEIQRTIDAFSKKIPADKRIEKCVIAGPATELPAFIELLEKQLGVPIEKFESQELVENNRIESTVKPLPPACQLSIAASIPTALAQEFNLLQEQAEKEADRTITYQLATAAALGLLLFLSFSIYSFFRVRSLRLSYKAAETEAINELKKNVKLKPSQTLNLTIANKAAQAELKKQESAWFRLSEENRYGFVRYLIELSRCINTQEVKLDLVSLIMKDDTIKLYGSVPGYKELTMLQQQLECPFFKKLPKLQDWNFKTDPITLVVNRQEL